MRQKSLGKPFGKVERVKGGEAGDEQQVAGENILAPEKLFDIKKISVRHRTLVHTEQTISSAPLLFAYSYIQIISLYYAWQ